MTTLIFFCLLGFVILPSWGCRSANNSEKLAEVDGTAVTRAEVERAAGKSISSLRQQLYQLERQKLDEYVGAMLLTREAKSRGISASTLLDQEVNSRIAPVTEAEIEDFYSRNKDRLRVDLEKVHDQIHDYLREQRLESRKNEFFKTLRSKAKVTTYLKSPPIFRADVAVNGAPFKGSERAQVTIVKFEDFQCPYCKTVQATYQELLRRYNGKVRLVHKDLPLDAIHPQARQAAEAARCAGEQGKFWEYHDRLYVDSPKAGVEELKSYGKDVGLNMTAFDQCVTSGKYRAAVQKDLNEGAQLGLTGTPTFFINGREFSGAQPVEAFAAIIDEELAQGQGK
jgi:protein-disulfide isomerase